MIVLGPLIVITILLVVMVVAGKLLYDPAPIYIFPDRPILRIAAAPAPVFRGTDVVTRIEPGDSIWVVRAGDGSTVLFADSLASEVIGVSRVVLDVPATGTTTAH